MNTDQLNLTECQTKFVKAFVAAVVFLCTQIVQGQTLSQTQMQNARATGYAIIAARNPGKSISVMVIPWDGVNTLEYNANNQINSYWHAQAAIKGNFFNQNFDGNDFSTYSSVILSQGEFDQYKHTGTQWWIVCSYEMSPFNSSSINIINNGDVGIGTTTPKEKLSVNGSIRSKEVKVEAANWPDYVFEEGYKVGTLDELESYIKKNKHLPNMPSAKEAENQGVELGNMVKQLLKNQEELTLHLIRIEKENKKLKKVCSQMKREINDIKTKK